MRQDALLSLRAADSFEITNGFDIEVTEFLSNVFQNPTLSEAYGRQERASMNEAVETNLNDYMAEINDFLMDSLYKELTCIPKLMSREQAEFQHIADEMFKISKPSDFGIPEAWLNDRNKALWSKAIRELKKLDK